MHPAHFPDTDTQAVVQQLERALSTMDLASVQNLLDARRIKLSLVDWHPDPRNLPEGPLPALWRWWHQRCGEAGLPRGFSMDELPDELASHAALVRRLDEAGWQFRYAHYGRGLHEAAGTDHTGRTIAEIIRISNAGLLFLAAFRAVHRHGLPLYTIHFDHPRLQTVFWHRLLLPLADEHGQIRDYLLALQPRTEGAAIVDREAPFFRDENRYLRSLLTDSPMGVGIFAGELAFMFANPALATMLKTTVADLRARQLVDIYAHEEDFIEQVIAIRRGEPVRNRETCWRAADDSPVWVALSYERIHFTGLNAILIWAFDITGRRQLEQELLQMARTDPLTGVLNRRHFLELAEQERQRSQRYAMPGAVLMLDVDHFKEINDHHGHGVGDQALHWLARCLGEHLRANDLLGRMGGEEFALLLPNTGLDQAREAAERLREALRAGSATAELPAFTVSIGITGFRPDDDSMEAPLLRADRALYRAKAEGRDRVVSYRDGESSSTTLSP